MAVLVEVTVEAKAQMLGRRVVCAPLLALLRTPDFNALLHHALRISVFGLVAINATCN